MLEKIFKNVKCLDMGLMLCANLLRDQCTIWPDQTQTHFTKMSQV